MAKIAILTNFQDFNPGYSLTGIVSDQMSMLARYEHDVHLFICTSYNRESVADLQKNHPDVTIHPVIPFAHLIDYTSKLDLTTEGEDEKTNHKLLVKDTRDILVSELADFDHVFTHDWVFTGWFLPYGLACVEASKQLPGIKFFHWIHSIPSVARDWWRVKEYGSNHKLVFPNSSDAIQVAEQYVGELNDVRVIPHFKDARSWFDFGEESCKIIDAVPSIMQADVVQILPAGSDRLSAKRVDYVIKIFGYLKQQGLKVSLVVANQWATGRQRKQCLEPFDMIARQAGLEPRTEFVFTSDIDKKFENGLNKKTLRELFLLSNLFVFPTREETFGLVVAEAAMSGCFMVLNKSLGVQKEISGNMALYFDFGSFNHNFQISDPEKYFSDIAWIITGQMRREQSIMVKTYFKQRNNWDSVYHNYYMPIMMENKEI
jgi:glycosyltransferase involved in cell wall biosynthesis